MNKFFYLHIPKTAGTTFNKFLSHNFNTFIDHIESKINFNDEKEIKKLDRVQCFSGHIVYPVYKSKFNSKDRKIITILRNPIEQIVSHVTYVRELGEETEKHRLEKHTDIIKKLVNKLKIVDLSKSSEIKNLIKWLEDNQIWLFHDCQTRYLGGGVGYIKPMNLHIALENLEKIEYVGVTERLKEFMILLAMEKNFELINFTKENVTKNRYGLDISNFEIRQALQPLIQNDHIVYNFARKKFIDSFYRTLYNFELKKDPRFSSVKIEMLFNEMRRNNV